MTSKPESRIVCADIDGDVIIVEDDDRDDDDDDDTEAVFLDTRSTAGGGYALTAAQARELADALHVFADRADNRTEGK